MKTLTLSVLLACGMLAGCAAPQSRVEAGLIKAGVSPRMAACMADRMVDRLSSGQLRRLQSLSKVGRTDLNNVTVDQLLYQVRALEDPEIMAVTTKAALLCALS
ncbi:MAG: hypothetical protein QHC67_10260 [Sphingobium sp.]|uniref:hypothetical protein n=1 Tax=Sphingobium sp. TaxID=1912891 RepID=UPI0029B0F60B|nr:hypothetical protein [Sphingobium sp.]MDX3910188.1 hypothetical protein [Sphingobium sp.]